MTLFQITYTDPATGEEETIQREFSDWTGRATDGKGNEVGPVMTITAREWAEDVGYSFADKGPYRVEEIRR